MRIKTLAALAFSIFTALNSIAAESMHETMHQRMHQAHMSGKGDPHTTGQHDEVNMPGLNGRDTTAKEVGDLKALFINHKALRRSVEHLPNGVRTLTETDDDALRTQLMSHVAMMLARMQSKRDPEVRIQSPTLTALFKHADAIDTTMEMTATGVAVNQTSADPEVVALLQTHAAEVSDMSARGMQSVHERMRASHHSQ